jgi:TonB-dependent starch-binding outer membrane protein SusC
MPSGFRSASRGVFAAVVALLVTSTSAFAQVGTVRGRVTEAATGRPISDAQVLVGTTGTGAVTNAAGEFVITNAPAGTHDFIARRIGFNRMLRTVTVPVGGEVRIDFAMTQSASQLGEVVITGTVGAAEKRTIGNSVTQLDVAELTDRTTLTTVSQVLQGRTPGVNVMSGSGAPGTAAEITVRGYGTFTNNRPVIYIDGVRMDIDDLGTWNPSGAGTTGFSGQRTSALDLINPNDIESIEVIKGPAAATLYGADAAQGVIQIITKKGRRGQQGVRWNTKFETGSNKWGTETLTNYTTCTPARIAQRDAANLPVWEGCQGVAPFTILSDDPLRRDPLALRTGDVNNISTSLRGGGDRYSYYISGDQLDNEGYLFNSRDFRRSLRSNFTFQPNQVADFTLNVGYIRQNLRLPLGDEAGNGLLLSAARGIPGLARPRESLRGWGTLEPALGNLYNNQTNSDRLILSTTVNYHPLPWLRNRLIAGMDWRSSVAQILSLPGDPDVPAGLNAMRSPTSKNYTLDYAGTITTRPFADVESQTSVGSQLTSERIETITATGTSLPTREITTIGSALNVSGSNAYREFNTVGIYGQQQFGWRDRLWVTGAIRADDQSSFGANFDWIVYPKASISWVLSEEPFAQPFVNLMRADNFRLRSAWGRAGRAPAPYSAVQTYGSTRVALNSSAVGGALVASAYGNPDLKPERGEEVEVGFESDYLGGRFALEATYYNKVMKDLLVPIALPPSLGFAGSQLQNLGHTTNRGLELGLSGTPVSRSMFAWDSRLSMSFNRNRLVSLDTIRVCTPWIAGSTCPVGKSNAEEIPGGASYSPGMQRNRIGYPLGSYFARFPLQGANGDSLVRSGAVMLAVYDTAFRYVGPALPTRMVSLSNTMTFLRNFQLYVLLDHHGGHWLYNQKSYNRCATVANGPNCAMLNDPAITQAWARGGQDSILAQARFDTLRALYGDNQSTPLTVSARMTQTQYIEQADFIKLRDISLTYTLPPQFARAVRMETASVVVAGKNLKIWTDYSGLDPEVNGYSNNQLRGSGNAAQFVRIDAYSWPQTRRYTIAFNFSY